MYTQRRSRIRNPAAYAAAVERNAMMAPRSYRSRYIPAAYKSRLPVGARVARNPRYKTSVFSDYGGRAGSWLGEKAGSYLGGLAGSLLGFKRARKARAAPRSRQMKAGRTYSTAIKSKTAAGGNGVTIQHREFITDIYASKNFTNTVFPINPGLASSFPWLSGAAQNFEQYQIDDMCFEFRTTSVDALNSTNTALGVVIMTTDYNVLNDPFINVQQMENNVNTVVTKPSLTASHCIECRPFQTPVECLNVRLGQPTSGDLRLYDLGNFQVGVSGMQDQDFVIGQLFCTYTVTLYKPKLSSGLNLSGQTAQFTMGGGVGYIVPQTPFGPSQPRVDFNAARITWTSSTPGGPIDTFNWPLGANGIYRFTYRVRNIPDTGLFSDKLAIGTLTYTNCAPQQVFLDYTSDNISNMGLDFAGFTGGFGGTVDWIFSQVIQITDPTQFASITLDASPSTDTRFGNTIGSFSIGDFILGQVNGDLPLEPLSLVTSRMNALDIRKMIESVIDQRSVSKSTKSSRRHRQESDESKDDFEDVVSPPQSSRRPPPSPGLTPLSKSSKKQ